MTRTRYGPVSHKYYFKSLKQLSFINIFYIIINSSIVIIKNLYLFIVCLIRRHITVTQRRTQLILFTVIWRDSNIWQTAAQIAREETRCRHMGYSFRLTARVLLYALSHRQDNTYHGLCYSSDGALAETRNSSMSFLLLNLILY